ncbi:predicted MFS family arabinose efflux permease [Bacillus oleivorans]|uniref:Predicted MFS family arabinose efflux permease n=1 Tax=Bacillus oleivorans TaxID=1448271 RepID=A0A285CQG4_9BACI|nr:MFS transporter [Bacillus oleivorans]SNX69799.1 predicted MFS family arabinose efflux permease [Bacillus oleivorans]
MKGLFNNRKFILLWLAQAASGLGSTFSTFALSWLVYKMTGSKVAMGSVWVAFMLPNIIIQMFAGPYLDRWERKKVMIFSEWFRASAFLIPIILYPMGQLETWHLYLVSVATGIAQPLFAPSSMAYVADILPKDKLMKGNSILEGTGQIMMLLGPSLGGLLITAFGVEYVLLFLLISLGLSGLLLMLNPSSKNSTIVKRESWFVQFREGLQFYRVYPVLFWVGIMMMFINTSYGAAQPMFLPYVLDDLGGTAFQYGLFTSAFSFGMFAGSLLTGIQEQPKNRKRVMLRSLFLNGLLFLGLAWTPFYWVALILSFGQGLFAIIFNINNTTLYQQRVPDHLRGRVFSVRILLAQAGIPIGAALGSFIAETFSISILLLVLGCLICLTTIICFLNPMFNNLNDNNVAKWDVSEVEKSL